jgi:hypothetical protein
MSSSHLIVGSKTGAWVLETLVCRYLAKETSCFDDGWLRVNEFSPATEHTHIQRPYHAQKASRGASMLLSCRIASKTVQRVANRWDLPCNLRRCPRPCNRKYRDRLPRLTHVMGQSQQVLRDLPCVARRNTNTGRPNIRVAIIP